MSRPTDRVRTARIGAMGFTVLALVLTGLTALLLSRMIGSSRYANEPLREIVVAQHNLPASDVIARGDLKVVRWPASSVPEGAFATTDALFAGGPRVPVSTILAGEPVVSARLADASAGTGMASLVPRNLRGFPIPVEGWIAKARLVYPGAVVDVLSTMKDPEERKPVTKLVLQKVQVLAVNGAVDAASEEAKPKKRRRFARKSKSKAVVTLLVTPEQAETLALSAREGKLDLMLRNAGDEAVVQTEGVSPTELLDGPEGEESPAKASKAKPRRRRTARRGATVKARPDRSDRRVAMNSRRRGGTKTIRLGAR